VDAVIAGSMIYMDGMHTTQTCSITHGNSWETRNIPCRAVIEFIKKMKKKQRLAVRKTMYELKLLRLWRIWLNRETNFVVLGHSNGGNIELVCVLYGLGFPIKIPILENLIVIGGIWGFAKITWHLGETDW